MKTRLKWAFRKIFRLRPLTILGLEFPFWHGVRFIMDGREYSVSFRIKGDKVIDFELYEKGKQKTDSALQILDPVDITITDTSISCWEYWLEEIHFRVQCLLGKVDLD